MNQHDAMADVSGEGTNREGPSSTHEREGWRRQVARVRRTRLGRKLLVRILSFSMFLALFATGVQLLLEYRWDVDAIRTRLGEIEISRVKSVANSIWEFDRGQTEIELDGILHLPDIARVELETTLGEQYAIGHQPSTVGTIVREYQLFSPKDAQLRIGTMRVVASLQGVYARLWSNVLVILATQSVKTFFVAMFILFVVHALVTRRLGALASVARRFDVDSLERPIQLVRSGPAPHDELDELVNALDEMGTSLQAAFRERRRIEERARFLSDASRMLAAAIGRESTAQCIAGLVAPKLATACLVFTTGEDQETACTIVEASDPKSALLREQRETLRKLLPVGSSAATTETAGRLTEEPLASSYGPYLAVSLVARDRTLGQLLLLADKDSPAFPEETRSLVLELGSRAALALDNARLLAHAQRELGDRIRAEAALRRSEQMFLQAQKMEAMGRLVAGVAHDFNNMLCVILGNCQLALLRLSPNDPLHTKLSDVVRAGETGAALIRQLLAFGRKQILHPEPINLWHTVEAVSPMLRRLTGERVVVVLDGPNGSHWVHADRVQLEQVLMNLVTNARDAIDGYGTVTLACHDVVVGGVETDADTAIAAGEYVALTVSDTGSGIDEATQMRIFEPFYTTKERGRGTGLGLATVLGIVEQSGGHVRVASSPGAGTTFTVLLPRIAAYVPEALPEHGPVRGTPLDAGGEVVLVVEDDEPVRRMVTSVLLREGFRVLEAADAERALQLVHGCRTRIDLVLTDVALPKVSGVELARKLLERLPGLRVVFMSGYAEELVHTDSPLLVRGFLAKPFGPDGLLRKVREALRSPASELQAVVH